MRVVTLSFLLFLLSSPAMAALSFQGCTPAQENLIRLTQSRSAKSMEAIKDALSVELSTHQPRAGAYSVISEALSVSKCILRKINQSTIICRPKTKTCDGSAVAYVMPFYPVMRNRVNFCPEFFTSPNDWQPGTYAHELSHVCGTSDAARFGMRTDGWRGPPVSVGLEGWSHIADTYGFWVRYGFCVPGVDCQKFDKAPN